MTAAEHQAVVSDGVNDYSLSTVDPITTAPPLTTLRLPK